MIQPFKRNSFALLLGIIALILVFSINLTTNLYSTSLIRGIIAFVIFYILGSLLHLVINSIIPKDKVSVNKVDLESDINFNLDEIYQTATANMENYPNKETSVDFQPLELKKIEFSE